MTKWIVHGTLNAQVMGSNLSAASWLCNILGQDVNSMHASPYQDVKLGLAKTLGGQPQSAGMSNRLI